MIYFDYAANTPVDPVVMDCFVSESNSFIANPNSVHPMGSAAKERLGCITDQIADRFQIHASELIYTSGASEANNLAIKGIASSYKNNGKHIISTCLEHSSVSGALTYLQSQGYEIDLVEITSEGLVDLKHLKELLRKDTILVSICSVDSELGVRQPIEEIGDILAEYPDCFFHTDATQAIGKVSVCFEKVDLVTLAPHKFYGLNGCGILIKKDSIVLTPLIHGGSSTTIYRSGTPTLALVTSMDKALELALSEMEGRNQKIIEMNRYLKRELLLYKKVRINSTDYSIPHILNLSVQGVKGDRFQKALGEAGICVSVKSACSVPGTPSRPVYAVSKDKKNAMCSWRISLSHLTTKQELEDFLRSFHSCYDQLTNENN